MAQTLFEKLWQQHLVEDLGNGEGLIAIDRIFLHERTGSIALQSLEDSGRKVRSPQRVFCTMDHIVDTFPNRSDNTLMPSGKDFIQATRASAKAANIRLFDLDDPLQGIAHVISPELGIALPGATLVCPDSHTCTLGGLGALAWGIGSTEAEHAMATDCLRVKKPKTLKIEFNGTTALGVTAKDMILHLIGHVGASAGVGHMIEFCGEAITNLDIESRLTLCNMAVEMGGFSAIIAPDDKTIAYVQGRQNSPKGDGFEQAKQHWLTLYSDTDALFDKTITIDSSHIQPTVTWGTSPEHTVAITGVIPNPESEPDSIRRSSMEKALNYQGLLAGTAIADVAIDAAFIGSCTNARISDLRAAAGYLKGRKVAAHVKAVCVPGSGSVKRQAEAEGLDQLFIAAGFEWREPGCSMCFYAGGETFGEGKRVISSTNRNFEGRQGPNTRTHLASPITVAASAVAGRIAKAEVNA